MKCPHMTASKCTVCQDLKKALSYAEHRDGCPHWQRGSGRKCNCGFVALLLKYEESDEAQAG